MSRMLLVWARQVATAQTRHCAAAGGTGARKLGRLAHGGLSLILILVLLQPLYGAFNATMQWDVRTTGADTNGGGFDPGVVSPGTDFSQQNGPAISYTDIIVGATTTQGTSVAHPFDTTIPGNVINITAGCTVQRVEVLSVSGITATFDKSLGTAASVCTGALGGSLLTPATAAASLASQNTVHVKAGTYTFTTTLALATNTQIWWGYGVTHKDGGTRPLFTTATNSTVLITAPSSRSAIFRNMVFSNAAATPSSGLGPVGAEYVEVSDCKFSGFTNAIAGSYLTLVTGCEFTANTLSGISTSNYIAVQGSYFHDNLKDDINYTGTITVAVSQSIFANTPRYALASSANDAQILSAVNCVFYKTGLTFTGHPFAAIQGGLSFINALLVNDIFYGGGTTYFTPDTSNGAGTTYSLGHNNAIDSQGMAFYSSVGDVALTVDPFVNGATGNFALNSTAGGGLGLKQTGFPGVFPGGTSTGYLDVGAVQTSGAPGTGGVSVAAYSQ
jgi:hypothetical protein